MSIEEHEYYFPLFIKDTLFISITKDYRRFNDKICFRGFNRYNKEMVFFINISQCSIKIFDANSISEYLEDYTSDYLAFVRKTKIEKICKKTN